MLLSDRSQTHKATMCGSLYVNRPSRTGSPTDRKWVRGWGGGRAGIALGNGVSFWDGKNVLEVEVMVT